MSAELAFQPSENPFAVEHGGFYRRWFSMIDDIGELQDTVAKLTGTTEDVWVPVWRERGRHHEAIGDQLEAAGDHDGARRAYLQAKTYYAIGRFPSELTPVKAEISADCSRAYLKACAHLDPPMEVVRVPHGGMEMVSHYRAPAGASADDPVPAVLIMCGADVFKEDRGWAQEMCVERGMAALVMDAPGTGENPFPWSPESVTAWEAAIDWLMDRPEVSADKVGAFGISRGGYSVMQLAGHAPDKIQAVVANAGHPFGYELDEEETQIVVDFRNQRADWRFGGPDDPPSFPVWSAEKERELFESWSLSALGIVDNITMPVLMVNGKHDPLAPIGNIYFMLEHGPATGREARVYADAGHCAFKHFDHWAPACFDWLLEKLS
ncbi:MAG: alpha/beta hydrolase [Acidimicrobiia bacterium]|nr:MAG: alpha/beta hydrolase [Acidimicrobiia bacterium]